MANEQKLHSDTKAKVNPLGSIGRKPGSYVGDLDSLLSEVGESTPQPSMSSSEAHAQSANRVDIAHEKPPTKRINLDVPAELHRRFKGATGMSGRTMTDVLQELIHEYLNRERQ